MPPQPAGAVTSAWVQAAADGNWVVRALTESAQCPVVQWQEGELALRTRAQPVVVAARQTGANASGKDAVFTLRSCEAVLPVGATEVRVGRFMLKAPPATVQRLLIVADTGCRLKQSEQFYQDCNNPSRWPFAQIARTSAALKPDLVIHLGDLHYRESPCPADRPGCVGSPWGYGDDAWQADFFIPAAPLLQSAPWVFVRGNHESCGRAGVGWSRYLDGHPRSANSSCEQPRHDLEAEFSVPYAVALSAETQLIVFDSAFAAARPYLEGDPLAQRYAAQLAQVNALARRKPHSFFLNHHPVLGFATSASGKPKPGQAALQAVMQQANPARLYADGVDVVLNGHVHLFEALGFSSPHPTTLVLGNAGSAMEGQLNSTAALAAQPAPGAVLDTFVTQPGFGFATLDKAGGGWQLTEWSVTGQALVSCRIDGARLHCKP